MKKNLLVELNAFIEGVRVWDFLDSEKIKRGVQLLMDSAQELAVLRSSHTKLHSRAQLAENALPEWKEICAATAGQATGRFFPALIRLALRKAEEENAELYRQQRQDADELKLYLNVIVRIAEAVGIDTSKGPKTDPPWMDVIHQIDRMKLKIEKQGREMGDMNDLYIRSFELAGGQPDDNVDDLPKLISGLFEKLAARAGAIVVLRQSLVRSNCPVCDCGANTHRGVLTHAPGCYVEPLVADTPANRALTDGLLSARTSEVRLPSLDDVLSLAQEIATPIGTIPGTANLGPGVEKVPFPTLPLHYELMPDSSPPNARVFDATGKLICRVEVHAMRGRCVEDDLRIAAALRIKLLTRAVEERAKDE